MHIQRTALFNDGDEDMDADPGELEDVMPLPHHPLLPPPPNPPTLTLLLTSPLLSAHSQIHYRFESPCRHVILPTQDLDHAGSEAPGNGGDFDGI